jgi:alpha-tubulin suppressor-like RCC1 family protein
MGINCFGQLGVGEDHNDRTKPAVVEGRLSGVPVAAVASGGMHTVVLAVDGSVRINELLQDSLIGVHIWLQR